MAKQNKSNNIMIGKSNLHVALAQSFKRDIDTGYSKYYYYLSASENINQADVVPIDSISYEMTQRRNIFIAKHVMPFEVSLMTRRYDWIKNEVYTEYDDITGGSVLGIDVLDMGANYSLAPIVYVGSTGSQRWIAGSHYDYGAMVSIENEHGKFYFICITNDIEGITSTDNETNLSGYDPRLIQYGCGSVFRDGDLDFLPIIVNDAGGNGATAEAIINERLNTIASIRVINGGKEYINDPSIFIVPPFQNLNDEDFRSATAEAIIKGSQNTLRDEKFYVVTEELNVYKCIHNNEGAQSTVQPYGTSQQLLTLADGYKWLFMYNINQQAFSRFMNAQYMPIIDYNPESVDDDIMISIVKNGKGYEWAKINVTGDGYLKENPYYLRILDSDITINTDSPDYSLANIKSLNVEFESPHSGASEWIYSNEMNYNSVDGKIIKYGHNFYKVIGTGNYNNIPPRHTAGRVSHDGIMYEYYGSDINVVYDPNASIKKFLVEKNVGGASIANRGGKIPRTSVIYRYGEKQLPFTQTKSGTVTFNVDSFMTEFDVVDVKTKSGEFHSKCKLDKASNTTFNIKDSANKTLLDIDTITFDNGLMLEFYFVNGHATECVVLNQGSHMSGSEIGGTVFESYTPGNTYGLNNIVAFNGKDYICVTSGKTEESELEINTDTDSTDGAIFKELGSSVLFNFEFKSGGFYRYRPKSKIEYIDDKGMQKESTSLISIGAFPMQKSEMVMIPTVDITGEISDVRVVKYGHGYTYANINVVSDNPNLENAHITATIYNSLLDNTFNDRRLITVGEIFNIKMITRGVNYNWEKPPIVTINGDGTGCKAFIRETDIDPRTGAINKITISDYGKDYTWADVIIENQDEFENGSGAMARVIISPIGGHSSNPIYELFGDTVMLYTDLNNLEYENFHLTSAYRASGLIKNPRNMTNSLISGSLVTTAYNVTLQVSQNQSLPSIGNQLSDVDGNLYKILNLYFDSNNLQLHLLLSDINNSKLKNILTLINNEDVYNVISINPPTINAMTGDLLTIDNSTISSLSEVENAIIRTAIEF